MGPIATRTSRTAWNRTTRASTKFVALLTLALALVLPGCTNRDGATHALQAAGYRNIEITGYEFLCSDDDDTCTGFTAVGPTGVHVSGAVGCGYVLKGCTIRIGQ